MSTNVFPTKLSLLISLTNEFRRVATLEYAFDGMLRLRARRQFQRSGLFATLPLTGTVLEVEGGHGHLAEAAVHHIPNRRCFVVDARCGTEQLVDRRVRRRKFHRVCAAPDRLPFADGVFDAAWATFALSALDPAIQETVLGEMRRVVRPGGVLIALERAPATLGERWHARITDLCLPSARSRPRYHRSPEGWLAVMARNGWCLQTNQYFDSGFGPSTSHAFVCRRL